MWPEAVVFDCDGVLVDSEPASWQAWADLLARYGYEVADGDYEASIGRTVPALYERFAARVDLPPLKAFEDELTRHTLELFDAGLTTYPDATATLDVLARQGVRLAVASSSSTRRLTHTLAICGIRDRFAAVVAGDEVDAGKPAGDIYREAARRLRVPASACVAVEDAPAGVTAARAAGMPVVAVVRAHVARSDLADADVVVDRLTADDIRSAHRA